MCFTILLCPLVVQHTVRDAPQPTVRRAQHLGSAPARLLVPERFCANQAPLDSPEHARSSLPRPLPASHNVHGTQRVRSLRRTAKAFHLRVHLPADQVGGPLGAAACPCHVRRSC